MWLVDEDRKLWKFMYETICVIYLGIFKNNDTNTIQQIQEKKERKKNENKTRNTQSKRTNNEIIDLITKHQWEKKMKKGKKCGRAEKWHERRKKKWSKRKKNSHVSAATQSYEGGTSDLSTPWMSLLIMLKYTLAYSSMPCMCVWRIFICDEHIFFPNPKSSRSC